MSKLDLKIPDKLLPIMEPKRFKVLWGGRAGAKSHTIAQVILALGTQRPLRVLCARETQRSLKQSSKQVLTDYIKVLKLERYYSVLRDEIRSNLFDTAIDFTGLKEHTADSILSYEACDLCWIEQAERASAHSCNILIPTIRKPGSEIWMSLNPDQADDYVYDRFIAHEDPEAWVVNINWNDNPWLSKESNIERMRMQALNDDLYQHIWEGKLRSASGVLFKRHWFKRFDVAPQGLSRYMASDFAVTPDGGDCTEHGIAGLDPMGNLYIDDWWFGHTDPEESIQAAFFKIEKHQPKIWFEEKGVIRLALNSAINKRIREEKVRTYRHPLASTNDKAERALGFAARASAGAVYIKRCPWGERLINQLCAFTGEDGRPDDAVDVCSLFGRGLEFMSNAQEEKRRTIPNIIPFSRAHLEAEEREREEQEIERRRHSL